VSDRAHLAYGQLLRGGGGVVPDDPDEPREAGESGEPSESEEATESSEASEPSEPKEPGANVVSDLEPGLILTLSPSRMIISRCR
jgi:hypothetical protein